MEEMKILAIAPYEGLRDLILSTARELEDTQVDVYVGDMDQGAEIAAQAESTGYDVIISRGGTAEAIEKITSIPVIDIEFSEYDIISALRIAQSYGGKYAIVGFPSMAHRSKSICEILNEQTDIITLTGWNEVDSQIETLRKNNYTLVIGDVIAVKTARQQGLNAILITSNRDNIKRAFSEARRLFGCMRQPDSPHVMLERMLDECDTAIALYNSAGRLMYNNFSGKDFAFIGLHKKLEGLVGSVLEKGLITTLQRWESYALKIQGKLLSQAGRSYACFYVTRAARESLPEHKSIVVESPALKSGEKLNYFTEGSRAMAPILEKIRKLRETQSPVLICGEVGTGKDSAAAMLHSGGIFRGNPMITIHCAALTEAQWSGFVNNGGSPINDVGYTIYFKDIHCLSPALQESVSQYIEATALSRRHYLLSSSLHDMRDLVASEQFSLRLYSQLGVFTLYLPSLSQRKEDIPGIIALLIAQYNISFSKNVVGLEPDALEEMVGFPWALNLRHLEMAMRQLIMLADSPYIAKADVLAVLQEIGRGKDQAQPAVDLSRTLPEITKEVIELVLAEEDMNQSRAARRLGISRSTLWRKLQEA